VKKFRKRQVTGWGDSHCTSLNIRKVTLHVRVTARQRDTVKVSIHVLLISLIRHVLSTGKRRKRWKCDTQSSIIPEVVHIATRTDIIPLLVLSDRPKVKRFLLICSNAHICNWKWFKTYQKIALEHLRVQRTKRKQVFEPREGAPSPIALEVWTQPAPCTVFHQRQVSVVNNNDKTLLEDYVDYSCYM